MWEVLTTEALAYTKSDSGALAFLLDENTNTNLVIKIKIHAMTGALISEIPKSQAIVIGSGSAIPNIQEQLTNTLKKALKIIPEMTLIDRGHLMRTKIIDALDRCGGKSFEKLGISPCMSISILDKAYFYMAGEIIEGEHISGKDRYSYKYSFEQNEQGKITLTDLLNDKVQTMKSFMDTDLIGEVFDPRLHAPKIDYSEIFNETDYFYLFHQWVINKNAVTDNFVYRSLKKVRFVTEKRLYQPSESLIEILPLSEKEIKCYVDCRDLPFLVSKELLQQFEKEICKDRLFDHKWLSKFIPNYTSIFMYDKTQR